MEEQLASVKKAAAEYGLGEVTGSHVVGNFIYYHTQHGATIHHRLPPGSIHD